MKQKFLPQTARVARVVRTLLKNKKVIPLPRSTDGFLDSRSFDVQPRRINSELANEIQKHTYAEATDGHFIHPLLALDQAQQQNPLYNFRVQSNMLRYISGDVLLMEELRRQMDNVHKTNSFFTFTMGKVLKPLDELKSEHIEHCQGQDPCEAQKNKIKSLQDELKECNHRTEELIYAIYQMNSQYGKK